ncbi:pyrroline-5-carboxylate reductase [Candidatus Peregrinibacteria bacterium]|nr:pyrroline-5-carboxylate reductase [Candidatus Peregrinibacteria bacterium]
MKDIIAIIGAGNMGAAFYRGMREHMMRVRLNVCDRNREKLEGLDADHAYTDPAKAIANTDVVLLAVKPQSATELLAYLSGGLAGRLVISVMAGVSLDSMKSMTRSAAVIRAMPNLPAREGRGLTGWIASSGVTAKQRALARELFLAVGREIEVDDETMMDAITALSGSGPAYFCLIAELLASKAIKEGFTEAQAALIARETLIGSAMLLDSNSETPSHLRAAVASKGGTTEAALRALGESGLDAIFFDAIDRAIARSRELNI